MAVAALSAEQVETLRSKVTGRVLTAGDDGYDGARRVHNGLIDRRPAVIAMVSDATDVVRRDPLRTRREPRHLRTWWRAQRGRTCGRRRRADDRPARG